MAEIHILDKNTVDQIAAGEVVERPSSVVKELVENAMDAGATAITVEIRNGGIDLIRITDNGSGIERSEIKKAFLRHATSKLTNIGDLFTLHTLGFRGEALSSISAIAQVEMITKTSDSLSGIRYTVEGGEEKDMEEVGAPNGTTIMVRNLFFNTPVRKKFLKSSRTEGSYVADLMEHLALDNPNVSFHFINNKDDRFHTSGNGDLKELIYRIYGRDVSMALVPIKCEMDGVRMEGYLGEPSLNRANRNFEIFFVNGRYVKDRIVSKAIEEGYKQYLMQHKFPFCVLHFVMEPDLVDVNVHPSKMEVKFQNQHTLFEFIRLQIEDALRTHEMIPEALRDEQEDLQMASKAQKERVSIDRTLDLTGTFHGEFASTGKQIGNTMFINETKENPIPEMTGKENVVESKEKAKQENGDKGRNESSDKVKNENKEEATHFSEDFFDDALEQPSMPSRMADQPIVPQKERIAEPFETTRFERQKKEESKPIFAQNVAQTPVPIRDNDASPIWSAHKEDNKEQISTNEKLVSKILGNPVKKPDEYEPPIIKKAAATIVERPVQMEMFQDKMLTGENRRQYRIIGQVFDTYWILEFKEKLYVVDQHAAHEKVNFERMMARFKNKTMTSQMMSPPVILTFSSQEKEIFSAFKDYFEKLGFQIDEFGGNEYAMRAVPQDLYGCDNAKQMFMEILDELSHDMGHREPDVIYYKIASMACKASVKGNMRMSLPEMEELIDELLTLENPYNCPHGRPTIISMSKYELDKRFKRVVD